MFFLFQNENVCFDNENVCLDRLIEMVLMMGHNIHFQAVIRKIIPKVIPFTPSDLQHWDGR